MTEEENEQLQLVTLIALLCYIIIIEQRSGKYLPHFILLLLRIIDLSLATTMSISKKEVTGFKSGTNRFVVTNIITAAVILVGGVTTMVPVIVQPAYAVTNIDPNYISVIVREHILNEDDGEFNTANLDDSISNLISQFNSIINSGIITYDDEGEIVTLMADGDGRSFDPISNEFRARQVVTMDINRIKDGTVPQNLVCESKTYAPDAVADGKIDASDDDSAYLMIVTCFTKEVGQVLIT